MDQKKTATTTEAEGEATDNSNAPAWDPNEYAKRKAQRNEKRPCEWVTNPVTNETFYLRRVANPLGLAMSERLDHTLTNRAVEAWEKKGIDVGESNGDRPGAASKKVTSGFEGGVRKGEGQVGKRIDYRLATSVSESSSGDGQRQYRAIISSLVSRALPASLLVCVFDGGLCCVVPLPKMTIASAAAVASTVSFLVSLSKSTNR